MKYLCLACLGVFAAACTTDRVSTELGDLATAVDQTKGQVIPALASRIEFERQLALEAAAQNPELWTLNGECADVIAVVPQVSPDACQIERVPLSDTPVYVGDATAAARKLQTLAAYIDALEALSVADAEDGVLTSYSTALGALGGLAGAVGSDGLAGFVDRREDRKPVADAVVSEAVAALRYQRLKDTVLGADENVSALIREIQEHLKAFDFDPEYKARATALENAETAAQEADPFSDPTAYAQILADLRDQHASFIEYVQTTQIYKIGLIARVHNDLANAMRSPGSIEDATSYIESLRALSDTIRGQE